MIHSYEIEINAGDIEWVVEDASPAEQLEQYATNIQVGSAGNDLWYSFEYAMVF